MKLHCSNSDLWCHLSHLPFLVHVQGLEVEVQKLITRHKSELAAAQEAAAADTASQLAKLRQQHEVDMAALKARMIKVWDFTWNVIHSVYSCCSLTPACAIAEQ